MTDRPFVSGVTNTPTPRRLTNISHRAALAFWVFASVMVWLGIVGAAYALF